MWGDGLGGKLKMQEMKIEMKTETFVSALEH